MPPKKVPTTEAEKFDALMEAGEIEKAARYAATSALSEGSEVSAIESVIAAIARRPLTTSACSVKPHGRSCGTSCSWSFVYSRVYLGGRVAGGRANSDPLVSTRPPKIAIHLLGGTLPSQIGLSRQATFFGGAPVFYGCLH